MSKTPLAFKDKAREQAGERAAVSPEVHCGDKDDFSRCLLSQQVFIHVTAFIRNPEQPRHGDGCSQDPERSNQALSGAPVSIKKKTEHLYF